MLYQLSYRKAYTEVCFMTLIAKLYSRTTMWVRLVTFDECAKADSYYHWPNSTRQAWGLNILWRFSTAWYGTVRYGTVHFWGVFHWVLYLVPDTFLVPLRSRFHANRTVTKTWRVNSADHWLAWENRHYCVTELATRDPHLQSYPLDLNQHSQRRIGRNFCNAHFCINHKIAVSLSVEEVQMFLSLIAEERIQRELDGTTPKEKALCI